jgi:hypothetical protein
VSILDRFAAHKSAQELCDHEWETFETDGTTYTRECQYCRLITGPHDVTASRGCIGRKSHDPQPAVKDSTYRDHCARCGWTSDVMTLGSPLATRHDLKDRNRARTTR